MNPVRTFAAVLCPCLMLASPAQATIGCSVVSGTAGADRVALFDAPGGDGGILHDIPLGDIVVYPQADLAPGQTEGWVWVRHAPDQQDIWQSGVYGWLKAEQIADCG